MSRCFNRAKSSLLPEARLDVSKGVDPVFLFRVAAQVNVDDLEGSVIAEHGLLGVLGEDEEAFVHAVEQFYIFKHGVSLEILQLFNIDDQGCEACTSREEDKD